MKRLPPLEEAASMSSSIGENGLAALASRQRRLLLPVHVVVLVMTTVVG
jgi:hypothetical protein